MDGWPLGWVTDWLAGWFSIDGPQWDVVTDVGWLSVSREEESRSFLLSKQHQPKLNGHILYRRIICIKCNPVSH